MARINSVPLSRGDDSGFHHESSCDGGHHEVQVQTDIVAYTKCVAYANVFINDKIKPTMFLSTRNNFFLGVQQLFLHLLIY